MDIVSILYVILLLIIFLILSTIPVYGLTITTIVALLFLIIVFLLLDYLVGMSRKIKSAPIEEAPQAPWNMIGGICEVLDEITPMNSGWVRYKGELWKAYSIKEVFKPGERAYVVDARGTYLIISREPPIRLSGEGEDA